MFSANASQVSNDVKYIEDFCSVYLRTGTGSSQTVTTGVKENTGVLVISKSRSAATDWAWYDTFRGATKELASNTTAAEITQSQGLTSFNTDGHTWGTLAKVNTSGATYVDFVLKPTPKFFDVVTWTGDGVAGRQISHSLGSAPGAIIVKCTSIARDWAVWQNTLTDGTYLKLNTTDSVITNTSFQVFGDASGQTSTYFTVGKSGSGVNGLTNANGDTYVAYILADDAGGFGLTGTDNVISCGSYVGAATDVSVSLGYEPQWLMVKNATNASSWLMMDVMRGMPVGADGNTLAANSSAAENGVFGADNILNPTATGFIAKAGKTASNENGSTHIYIAIRRGPMKVPTTGTKVFAPVAYTGNATQGTARNTGFVTDLVISGSRDQVTNKVAYDRLRGAANRLATSTTDAATSESGTTIGLYGFDTNNGYIAGQDQGAGSINFSGWTYANWCFRRAPGFFDEVCYSGNLTARTINHNLSAVPELMIVKARTGIARDWAVYTAATTATNFMYLNATDASGASSTMWNDTTPTASVFTVGTNIRTNNSGQDYVAYLFASCPGVSKVGSYTGTGTTQQINCGFTAGARFVLIKRTDSTGDWYVWDSARGIVAGNDPYMLLNSTAAEVTTTDYVDTFSSGFEISSTAPAAINASGGTFIYLAIA